MRTSIRACGWKNKNQKESASFCEQKEAKKLYLCWVMGLCRRQRPMTQHNQKFLRRFFQKAAAFFFRRSP
jgi:hypothetical protein